MVDLRKDEMPKLMYTNWHETLYAKKKCGCEYSCSHFDTLQYLHVTKFLATEKLIITEIITKGKLTFSDSSEEGNISYETVLNLFKT